MLSKHFITCSTTLSGKRRLIGVLLILCALESGTARKAAGKVHSDIERGFIRAEIYRYSDIIEHGSEAALKSVGKIRLEGKEYVVQDGDVINFRFNV